MWWGTPTKKRFFTLIIIPVAVALFLLPAAHREAQSLAAWVGSVIAAPRDFLYGFFRSGKLAREVVVLRRENEHLKALLLASELGNRIVSALGKRYHTARVYSEYPFNNRSFITVNAGRNNGIREGAPVTTGGPAVFVGHVVQVFEEMSLVRTIADPEWGVPVRVGPEAIDALLVGGREPRLTLVGKDKKLLPDQVIYTASRDAPYGLTVGRVRAVYAAPSGALQEATVALPYEPTELTEVSISLP